MLENVQLLEICDGMAGQVAGLLLAELGATVLKIEPPGGDPWRGKPGFATWNRNKRSLEVDLATSAGRERLHGLLAGTDVLIHDLPPSKAKPFGIDEESLAAAFPKLVVCSILGYPAG